MLPDRVRLALVSKESRQIDQRQPWKNKYSEHHPNILVESRAIASTWLVQSCSELMNVDVGKHTFERTRSRLPWMRTSPQVSGSVSWKLAICNTACLVVAGNQQSQNMSMELLSRAETLRMHAARVCVVCWPSPFLRAVLRNFSTAHAFTGKWLPVVYLPGRL